MSRSKSILPAFLCVVHTVGLAGLASADDTKPASLVEVVKPGETHSNGDVTVSNSEGESRGDALVDPKNGTAKSASDVTTKSSFVGEISGVEGNDTVSVGNSNKVTLTGTGGSISMGGSSTLTITNTGGQGAGDMTVKIPSGATVTIPPGTTGVVIST